MKFWQRALLVSVLSLVAMVYAGHQNGQTLTHMESVQVFFMVYVIASMECLIND